MEQRNIKIVLNGIELHIDGIYYPLLNEFTNVPPEAASFEVEKVILNGTDITIFLTELEIFGFDFDKLEYKCLEKILSE